MKLKPGVYVANARIDGVPEYDLLSDVLRDALGLSSASTYRVLVDRYLDEVGAPLVFQASDHFQLNRYARRAIERLADGVPVLVFNRGYLPAVECEDITGEFVEGESVEVGAVFDDGSTVTLVEDPSRLLKAVAVAGIGLLILRTMVDESVDFWVLTALGLFGLAVSKLG
ncbi:hypothetical protein [Methanopyrus sp. KOL6]|uniref:hypothetical protein n=1 Tax=Methanopyrus sp. KOL6 TaxID=1937004 RepID=UPI0012FA0EBE|nr:hypothetical protein [Methanopyrus sp. KOL6]